MSARPARAQSGVYVRQLAWFVLAIVLPCLLVIGFGMRMLHEQAEVTAKHAEDERRLRAGDIGRLLTARLDAIRRGPADAAVVIVASLANGRLRLPWDVPAVSRRDEVLTNRIAAAEREEFTHDRLRAAETQLRSALAAAAHPETAYARLALARVLSKLGDRENALHEYRGLLRMPLDSTDDNRIPIACYAAERLVDGALPASDADRAAILRVINAAVADAPTLPPAGWYELREIATRLTAVGTPAVDMLAARIDQRIADVEQALAMQRDAQSLIAQWHAAADAWLPYGRPLWLVGLGPVTTGGEREIIAVRADAVAAEVANRLGRGGVTLLTTTGTDAELLGEHMPGVRVRVDEATAASSHVELQRRLAVAALLIVIGVTLFGGYLLLRDVQREMRLADMRAQFVSSVSHELRTPLTAIRMFAETLQMNRADPSARREYLDTILNESERLTRLLDNVLDFSTIEQGRKQYLLAPASLPEIVRAAARTMAYPLAQQGFVLSVEADDTLPPVDVDADALEQAILNLLTNAMKYSGSARTIDLRLARDGAAAVISVRDEGIGIAPGDERHIFEKFYRVADPRTDRIAGTGLGLTLVDHIVAAHGGRVEVDSAPGRGSTFSIRLAIGAAPPSGAAEAAS